MATSEEKVELVETLKGPRYYRIQISGYGGESAYMSISKEAHDFWQPICEEHGDHDLVEYMACDDLEECDFTDIDSVPVEAQFLNDPDDDMYKRPWYESHTEFEHIRCRVRQCLSNCRRS
jgi:broad specificity phosphatase PhoE